jgi:hypothetical protein
MSSGVLRRAYASRQLASRRSSHKPRDLGGALTAALWNVIRLRTSRAVGMSRRGKIDSSGVFSEASMIWLCAGTSMDESRNEELSRMYSVPPSRTISRMIRASENPRTARPQLPLL